MRPTYHTLDRLQVHRCTARYLQEHIPFSNYKCKVTAPALWAVVLIACTGVTSLHAICSRRRAGPCEETFRKALYDSIPELAELSRRLNRALAGRLPRALRRRPRRLAIDLTLIPYHGEPFRDPSEVYRSQPRAGTSHFHAYATAYVVLHGERFTVALATVARGESMRDVVRQLLRQAREAGVRPSLILLDAGFFTADVIRYLQAARCPFLMPAAIRGRKPDDPRGPSSTRVFAAMKQSGWHDYRLTGGSRREKTARVSICVSCRNLQGRWRRRGRRTFVYACWGVDGHSCDWVRETYRRRFGIESSYRQMNQARGRTSTRRPELRLLYVGVALVLRNEWVWLHFEVLSTPRRGGRVIRQERLRLQTLLHWLTGVIELQCGMITGTMTERPICSELRN